MYTLKVRMVGNSYGVTLPKELVDMLKINVGDTIFATPSEDGVHLTSYDPNFEKAMEAFERTNRKYRNAFRELAKG